MAKPKDLETALTRALNELIKPNSMKEFGEEAANMIRLRTRLGYGVASDYGDKERLKPLSQSYKEQRKKEKLSNETSPGRSNLTKTGELLDSIKVKSVGPNSVNVGPTGRRTDGKSNEDVADAVAKNGRPFNNLSKVEYKRIRDSIATALEELIKKFLPRK